MSEEPDVELIFLNVGSEMKVTRMMHRAMRFVRQKKFVFDSLIYIQSEM
jgi:hypothetical protein